MNNYIEIVNWLNNPGSIAILAKILTDMIRGRSPEKVNGSTTLSIALALSFVFSMLAGLISWRTSEVQIDLVLLATAQVVQALVAFVGTWLLTEGQRSADEERAKEKSKAFEDDHDKIEGVI